MEIVEIRPEDREWWNAFVEGAPGNQILQSYEWGEIKRHSGWEPIRLAVRDNWKLVGGISILKRRLPRLPYSLYYSPRGPVYVSHGAENATEILRLLVQAVRERVPEDRALGLKIDPEVREGERSTRELLSHLGFQRGPKEIQPRVTMFLDLRRSLPELLAGFEEKTRYNIRLSQKKEVIVCEETTLAGVHNFYDMYLETAARDRFLIHSLSYYETVFNTLAPRKRMAIFTATHGEETLASVWLFIFGKRVWYMYGASRSRHRNRMPNHAIHWNVIQWAKENGYETYDLWGIPLSPDPKHPLFGVYRFKKGFNGEQVGWIGLQQLAFHPLFYILDEGLTWYSRFRNLLTRGRFRESLGD